ncbi:unnamed protein product [Peronospora effusa]|nr:unnamed protein product [Peronospora effusa]
MAGVRNVCSSPRSSTDEAEDAASFSCLEFIPSPQVKNARGKRKSKAQKSIQQRKKLKPSPSASFERKSTNKLIQEAPEDFIKYLDEQLSPVQQVKLETEFWKGQGYIVKLPPSSWKNKRKRNEWANWVRALGFTSSTLLGRNARCIASLKADVILGELKQRMPSITEKGYKEEERHVDIGLMSEDDALVNKVDTEHGGDYSTNPAMVRLKTYFQKLESQKLEVVSFAENHRLLSSIQHTAIADAMEDILARPSIRRDRRLARRLSKRGRISGRRLSSISLTPSSSSFLPLVEDDWVWNQEVEKMSLTPIKRRVSLGDSRAAEKKNVQGERVLYLVLQSGLIDVKTFKEVLRQVSTMAYAWVIADYSKKANVYSTAHMYFRHPRGHYLTNGAYKEVYKVFSSEQGRLEAISVMDISAIEATGNQSVVCQEVAHSVLLSDALEHGICPNFLRIYDVFLAHELPRPDLWGSKSHRKPTALLTEINNNSGGVVYQENPSVSSSDESKRLFQYIRMEFCDGGDLEDFIGLQKNKTLPLASVAVPFFFQMVYSLYCAREKFNLRHCDIKLLNFFLKDIGRANIRKDPGSDVVLHYLLEDVCFVCQMPASFSYWIKLADFGAADSNAETLGSPVTMDQFTTLENSPVEFLLEGDAAKQSYAADTFCLGLCVLHLFTGCAPYEEILEDVRCPIELLKDLKFIWMSPRKNSGFSVIKSVARGDDENTLCHTLYRFIVLFGLPERNPSERNEIEKVWQLLLKHLRPDDPALKHPNRRSRRTNGTSRAQLHAISTKSQFDHDQSLYSITSGSNDVVRRCREGLQSIPGAMELLKSLVDFDPAKRPTLKQVMYHPIFSSFRSPSKEKEVPPDYVISYYSSRHRSGRMILDV